MLHGPRPQAGPRWARMAAWTKNCRRAAGTMLQLVGAHQRQSGRGRAVWGTRHGAHQSSGSGGAVGRLQWSGGGGGARQMTNTHRHPTYSQNMHTDFAPAAYHNPDRLDPTQTIPTNRVKGPCRSWSWAWQFAQLYPQVGDFIAS
jgi:hypothetical protein